MIFKSYRKQVVAKMKGAAEKKATKAAIALRNHIVIEMASPKSGRQYQVPGTSRTYTASAPGEYPAIRFGQLRSGIQMATHVSLQGVFGIVGTNVAHGFYLEDGLRPWLSRALDEKADEIKAILEEPWF